MKWLEWPHLWTQKAQLHSSRGICDHCRRVQNAETVPRPSPAVGTVPKCFIFFCNALISNIECIWTIYEYQHYIYIYYRILKIWHWMQYIEQTCEAFHGFPRRFQSAQEEDANGQGGQGKRRRKMEEQLLLSHGRLKRFMFIICYHSSSCSSHVCSERFSE